MQSTGPEEDDFQYGSSDGAPHDAAGLPARIAIFADRPYMREEIAEDLRRAGFRAMDGGLVTELLDGPITLLGDAVMLDCAIVDAQTLAALARLDMRVARAGAHLIVATSLDALDEIYSVLKDCNPTILVDPSRSERLVAVGAVMARISSSRVREMSEDDRLKLLRLSQQVEAIAKELDRITGDRDDDQQRLSEFKQGWRGAESGSAPRIGSAGKGVSPPLPDPRVVRRIIARRQARAKFFDAELFSDPAWDMLLDLTAAQGEHRRVSVTSLCIAAGVPATTALRWIKQMVDSGVFERVADASDRRRAFIALSERSVEAMARYFAEVERPLARAA